MATVLTHAAIPLLLGRGWRPAGIPPRRLALVAVVLALLPDADYLGVLFDVRPEDPLGHRGLSHSLFVSLALALAGTLLFRLARTERATFRQTLLFLFGAAASHPLVDALARGEGGVALLAPLTFARFASPLRPLHTIPLGVNEAFGKWGAIVFAAEVLVVLVPLWTVVQVWRLKRSESGRTVVAALGGAWLFVVCGLAVAVPWFFGGAPPPVLAAMDLTGIPTDGLPDGKLATRYDTLQTLGLFDRPLTPNSVPWSSTFFPSWFGAEAGRWQDPKLTLVSRTLFGFHGPFAPLSPTEKYDAAVGDAKWTATLHALSQSHNGHPRFWFGLCNGVGAAALQYPEPYRTVDAVSPTGATIRFHPQDVKALLAAANYWNRAIVEVGDSCDVVRLDSGQSCSMNPATLVLAATNRLGLAHSSFLVDVHPTPQNQYYPVASATVRVTRPPYPLDAMPTSRTLAGKVAQLTDVEVRLVLSSTTLGYGPGNVLDTSVPDGTRYQRVGLREVPFTWRATLALGPDLEVVGGKWTGDPPIGPDSVAFLSGGPMLTDAGMVEYNPGLRWSVIEALARASLDDLSAAPRVEVAALLDGGTAPDTGDAIDGGTP